MLWRMCVFLCFVVYCGGPVRLREYSDVVAGAVEVCFLFVEVMCVC